MHQFNVKSLTFYTIAITSVMLLFKVVTVYGESQLKAPKSISGKYYITLAENLSNCKKNTLVLDVQQSGIFLNASLSSTPNNQEISTYIEKNPSLNGKLHNNSFSLSGRVNNTILCNAIPERLQASLVPEGGLSGQVTFKDVSKSIKFNAILQKPQEQSTQSFK